LKFLALEIENYPVKWNEVESSLMKAEARLLFDLQQTDLIRQIFFREDTKSAVLEWECDSIEKVEELTSTFPLVEAGMIHFEVIKLIPYPGYKRLFEKST
jgi:hypothetical protein